MMSTTAIVTINEGETKATVMARITDLGFSITDQMTNSDSNFQIACNETDMATIEAESSVEDIISQIQLDKLEVRRADVTWNQTINPDISATPNGTAHNWGLARCSQLSKDSLATSVNFPHDGTDVNCVIIDTGVMTNHPEFKDANGDSRVQQYAWKSSLGSSFYTDENGHGTHVAGTMCGLTQGWAKNAKIYSMKIFDTDALSVLEALQLVKVFHKSQTKPTVVNMSWGYYKYYPYSHPTKTGMSDYHPYRVSSVDAEIRDMIKAGIICVGAAGNANHIIDKNGQSNYNDSYKTTDWWGDYYDASGLYTWYPHRGSSPASASGVICVGATNSSDERATFSNYGGRVDIYAPGRYIQSAWIDTSKATHPSDNSFGLRKLSGTSMASPQVAGIVSCLVMAQSRTYKRIRRQIKSTANSNVIDESARTLGNGKNRLIHYTRKTQTVVDGLPLLPGKPKHFFQNGSFEFSGWNTDTFEDTDDTDLG